MSAREKMCEIQLVVFWVHFIFFSGSVYGVSYHKSVDPPPQESSVESCNDHIIYDRV